MTLANPATPYNTVRDAILTLLKNNKTTLNTGLTTTFTSNNQIMAGNVFLTPTPNTLYPVIMVKIISKKEEWLMLGADGRKRPTLTFRIYGITRAIGKTVDTEIMQLAGNIESVFRSNINIDNNVVMSTLALSDFGLGESSKGVYVDVVAIDLDCMVVIQ